MLKLLAELPLHMYKIRKPRLLSSSRLGVINHPTLHDSVDYLNEDLLIISTLRIIG